MAERQLGVMRALFVIPPESRGYLRMREVTARPRTPSAEGKGRGTGRGGKPPAAKLLAPLKSHLKRASFIKFIGGREVTMAQVLEQFPHMTAANVRGYLLNIHKGHGIGYETEGGRIKMTLPPGCNWKTVWT